LFGELVRIMLGRRWLSAGPSHCSSTDPSRALSFRGGTLALQCTMCHGDRGLSNANTPNLAGQYAPAIYKQLQDYKSGARTNAIMSPRVTNLTDQDMRDLAAYYSYLPRLPPYHPVDAGPVPQIVVHGAPLHNIPPCATCHGTVEYKIGTEWLEGESAVYLRTQLETFASGTRHNDISEQMRNIARGMTPTEIERAAAYYAELLRYGRWKLGSWLRFRTGTGILRFAFWRTIGRVLGSKSA
jgi:cytochrome c553